MKDSSSTPPDEAGGAERNERGRHMTAPEIRAPSQAATTRHRFKLHALRDVLNLPPPDWLVTNLMTVGSQVVAVRPERQRQELRCSRYGSVDCYGPAVAGVSMSSRDPLPTWWPKAGIVLENASMPGIQHRGLAPIDDMFFRA